tara:strand:- start:7700 stop:9163 length:1464 start_codon:yes stop_codon:yes gene_type:complete
MYQDYKSHKVIRKNNVHTLFALGLIALSMTACVNVGPDYAPPETDYSDQWAVTESERMTSAPVQQEWWTVFNDSLLESYIQSAIENNKNVNIALANLRRARELRSEAHGSLLPDAGVSSEASRSKSSGSLGNAGSSAGNESNFFDAGFDASWEVDVFGGNRRSIQAADARIGSAIADYRAAMLSTLSEVARNYFEARGFQKQLEVTEQSSELLKKTYEVIAARLEVGEASEFDLSRAMGEYQLTKARIPNIVANLNSSIFRLSVLLGQSPETLLSDMSQVKPLPAAIDIVPVGLRSEILRRRPDIQKAERELEAEIADIGIETSELFPKFFITGEAGAQSRLLGDLLKSSSGIWSIGTLIDWSLFSGGSIRARIKVQEAEGDAALLAYEQTVLEALADAEITLVSYIQELATQTSLESGVQSRRQSAKIAHQLFDEGEADYLAVLDAERELTSSEDDLVISETQVVLKLVALYTALGGGWEQFDQTQ